MIRQTNIITLRPTTLLLGMVIVAQVLMSCTSSLPTPGKDDLKQDRFDTLSLDELLDGRTLYITKCSGCHSLYLPKQYSSQTWDTILTVMNPKAKITNEEASRIRMYLTVYSNNN